MSEPSPNDGGEASIPGPPSVPENAPVFRRLHAATLLIAITRFVRNWAIPLFAVFFVSSGEVSTPWWFWAAILGTVGSGLVQILRFLTLRYGFDGDRLVLKDGFIFHQVRTIPISKIQNTHRKQGVLHRLFRVADLNVETAGSSDVEAELSCIALVEADRFERELLSRQSKTPSAEPHLTVDLVRRSSLGELIIAGATENRAGAIAAALLGLYEILDDFGDYPLDRVMDETLSQIDSALGSGAMATALGISLLIVAFILCGWFVSIFLTVITWAGFELHRRGTSLMKRHGLITKYEATIPLARVQVVRFEANGLRQLLGYAAIKVDTAGSIQDQSAGGPSVLCPLLPRQESTDFATLIHPDLHLAVAKWQALPMRARRRMFVRILITGLLGIAALIRMTNVFAAFLLIAWVPTAWILAHGAWRVAAYAIEGRFLISRSGLWTRRTYILPTERVQTVQLVRGPLQRMFGLATLRVSNAAASHGGRIRIRDLDADVGARLLDQLSRFAGQKLADKTGV